MTVSIKPLESVEETVKRWQKQSDDLTSSSTVVTDIVVEFETWRRATLAHDEVPQRASSFLPTEDGEFNGNALAHDEQAYAESDLYAIAEKIKALALHPVTSEEYDAGYIAARNDAFAIVQELIDNSLHLTAPVPEQASAACERCQGNGEIVTDWDRYLHSQPGDVGDEGTADCPDCDGIGTVPEQASVPDGFTLVPVEPTLAMRITYDEKCNELGLDRFANLNLIWPALLAASPRSAS